MAESSDAAASDSVDIKLVIVPEGFSHSRSFSRSLTLLEMKQQVEADLRIPVASMKLMFSGREMTLPLLSDYEWKEGQNNVRSRAFTLSRIARPPQASVEGAAQRLPQKITAVGAPTAVGQC